MKKMKINIPNHMPEILSASFSDANFDMKEYIDGLMLRNTYTDKGMWAFISWDWVNPFVEWLGNKKVLEVMSGAGWLAYALRVKNINLISTDNMSWVKSKNYEILSPIIDADAVNAIEKFGKNIDVLIISWPYMDDVAFETIKKLNEINPEAVIIYIGEDYGGCTASDEFFQSFKEIDDDENFNKIKSLFKSWPGIHDSICLGKYEEQKTQK